METMTPGLAGAGLVAQWSQSNIQQLKLNQFAAPVWDRGGGGSPTSGQLLWKTHHGEIQKQVLEPVPEEVWYS